MAPRIASYISIGGNVSSTFTSLPLRATNNIRGGTP